MLFDYNMKKQIFWTAWMFSFAFGQVEANSYEVRKIRLENLKDEILRDMKLMGCTKISDLSKSNIRNK